MTRNVAVIRRQARAAATLRARVRRDDGDTSLQMAILFPFVILLTIAVVQAGMWCHARNIALTAAREGVAAGCGYQATPADGAARARETLDRIAGDSLRRTGVSTIGTTAATVQVTVTGKAISLLPGIPDLHISQTASGARQRWTTP